MQGNLAFSLCCTFTNNHVCVHILDSFVRISLLFICGVSVVKSVDGAPVLQVRGADDNSRAKLRDINGQGAVGESRHIEWRKDYHC